MKTVVVGGFSFALIKTIAALVLPAMALFSQEPPRPDASGDFLLVLYLVGISTGLATLGFLIATSCSARWRRLAPGRGAIIAGTLGLVSPIAMFLVLAVTAGVVNSLFRTTAPWLAMAMMYGLPGIVLGGVAVAVARVWPGRDVAR